ncbi:Di-copper centre-containing protein [Zopfia rhizophila CBS 207.26]|uniref:tyrosinase n=1 Tax=Zopfia rhizophila CBS 207.26 TaxID=1314779 RepID=A0A6A6E2R4_9PEZI|nr:Di-copper centre-containing protein [Zopfia rhizophila CBS 207.26]
MVVLTRSLLPLTSLLVSSVTASPIGESFVKKIARQDGSFYAITGVNTGTVEPRLEIRELKQQPEAWNLFLLALQRFKAMDQSDKISFFQIAGIHGEPLIPWDGVQATGDASVGYCPHGSNLFGTWHKPYLAVFEQVLNLKAQEIAAEFPAGPTRDAYVNAASKLRLPFWDWALPRPSNEKILTPLLSDPTAEVTYPNGTTATIVNPLAGYTFHPLVPSDFGYPWSLWTHTARNPRTNTNPSLPDNIDGVESFLVGTYNGIRNTLYQILTQYQTFNQFSNTGSEQTEIGTLEGIHNIIHGSFGSGHMGYPAVAAFDPIFWLHHCNVDRIMNIFQAIYPDTFVTAHEQFGATYMNEPGDVWDAETPLAPFHSSTSGDFWTSNSARPIPVFGSTYPELVDNPSNDTIKERINALYAPAVTSLKKRQAGAEHKPRAYLAVIEAPFALDGTFSVDVFIGDITTDGANWPTDPNFVGAQTMLAKPGLTSNAVVKGSVVLTEALQKKYDAGSLKSLDVDAVVEYLKTQLHWRVEKVRLLPLLCSPMPVLTGICNRIGKSLLASRCPI